MKVLAVRAEVLDLAESPLNAEDLQPQQRLEKLTGAGVFDEEERLLPLVSGFLSHGLRNGLIAYKSSLTYGRNLAYCHAYLATRREFAGSERDEAFLDLTTSVIQEWFAHLIEEEGISKKTVRNRDSSLMAFFNNYLCRGVDDVPPFRTYANPYAEGLLSATPTRNLVAACSLADLKQLILATQSERERCVLQFIFDTGVRRSELPRVTLRAVDEALRFQDTQFVSRGASEGVNADYCPIDISGSKGPADSVKPRYSLISRATLMRVKKYHASPLYRVYARQFTSAEVSPAFLNAEGTQYTDNAVSKLLERVSTRALNRLKISKKISPHKLRHGYAYALLRSPDIGTDYLDRLVVVQKTMGHSRLQTAEVYTQIPQDLYHKLFQPGAETKTKAGEMEELVKQTRLKIGAGDTK